MPDTPLLLAVNADQAASYELAQLRRERAPATEGPRRFIRRLAELIDRYHPDRLAVCFDSAPSFRLSLAPTYRYRWRTSPDLPGCLTEIRDWLTVQGVACCSVPEMDAIDCLATLASRHNGNAILQSHGNLLIQTVRHDGIAILTHFDLWYDGERHLKWVKRDWVERRILTIRYPKKQRVDLDLRDWLMLTGDKNEGIPGVPGIARIRAQKLLADYGDLDAIQTLWPDLEIDGKPLPVEAIQGLADLFPRLAERRALVTLRTDLPVSAGSRIPDLAKFLP
jgi:5'-3' exonuclease